MEVHRDDVVAASSLEHVGYEFSGDRCTRLVLLVLACVREVGDDGGDAARRGSFACIDHDEEFHEAVINIAWGGGLEDEDFNALEYGQIRNKTMKAR